MKTKWKFSTKNFMVTWATEKEQVDTADMDPSLAAECRSKVNSGEWTCFNSRVQVTHRATGVVLGEAWLGNSIYADSTEFRDHFGIADTECGSYFSQMVRESLAEARKAYPKLLVTLRKEVKLKNAALSCTLRTA